jgi:hypothetical protein
MSLITVPAQVRDHTRSHAFSRAGSPARLQESSLRLYPSIEVQLHWYTSTYG